MDDESVDRYLILLKSNKTEVREIITYYDCQSPTNVQIFNQFYPNTTIISGTKVMKELPFRVRYNLSKIMLI